MDDTRVLKQIVAIFEDSAASKMDLEMEGLKVRLEKPVTGEVQPIIQTSPNPGPAAEKEVPAAPASEGLTIQAPLVGIFYAASAPDQPPYAVKGQHVEAGQTVCIIEAMKNLNEITAPESGTITKVLVQDGAMVEFGQALFELEPDL